MARDWFYVIAFVVFLVQLVLFFWARFRWLRVLPVILLAALSGGSLALYFYSGFTNWAWLIILVLFVTNMMAVVAAWMVFGLYRLVKKVLHI